MKDNYSRRIICDIDDTISMTITRDFENAEPIWPVIHKLNKLYDQGWEIWLVTARGYLSCKGDREAADKKYRPMIEKWLKKHGIKYHKLSFQKFLAQYYVDDKGLTPEEFVDLDIRDIKSGWSGAGVQKRGNRIFKTHPGALDEAKWYSKASSLIKTPKVHNIIGETLCLEYIENNGNTFMIDDVNHAINTFSKYRTYVPFRQYIDRMFKHCKANEDFYDIIPMLEEFESYYDSFSTFMHGDLSIENLIQSDEGLYFIDPIWKEDQWSSFLLDVSKMMHSFRKHKRMFEYEVFLNGWINHDFHKSIDEYPLQLLEVSQFIRVVKYIPNNDLKKEYHEWTRKMLSELKNTKKLSIDV